MGPARGLLATLLAPAIIDASSCTTTGESSTDAPTISTSMVNGIGQCCDICSADAACFAAVLGPGPYPGQDYYPCDLKGAAGNPAQSSNHTLINPGGTPGPSPAPTPTPTPTPTPPTPTPSPSPPPSPGPARVRPTRLLPVDGTVLHGAGQVNYNDQDGWFSGYRDGDPDPLNWPGKGANGTDDVYGWEGGFNPYSKALAKETRPAVWMVYFAPTWPIETYKPWFANLTKILDTYDEEQYVGVQFGFWFYNADADVAAGKYDEQLDALVEGFAALERPVWLRLGYEFNGAWTGFSPDNFKAAWIHMTKKFRAHPVTNRTVANVWDYTADAPVAPKDLVDTWYPGDEWVDWWGVNIFSGVAAPDSQWVTSDAYGFLEEAAKRNFPVMFGESTPRQNPMKWQPWFANYFALIHNEALTVRSFNYINWDWSKASPPPGMNWGNCRIDQSDVLAQYQEELRSPRYFHARSKAKLFEGLGIDLSSLRVDIAV